MYGLGDYHTDVVFDFGVAARFANSCGWLAESIHDLSCGLWWRHRDVLEEGFEGAFSSVFEVNGLVLHDQGLRLAEGLDEAEAGVRRIVASAQTENDRRTLLRRWETDNIARAAMGTEEFPPPLGSGDVAPVVHVEVRPCPPFVDRPAGLGVDSGRSMATPEALEACASSCEWIAGPLERDIDNFVNELDLFLEVCCGPSGWGYLYADELVSALRAYHRFVSADIPWVRAVGEAFRRAGGERILRVGVSDRSVGILLAATPGTGKSSPPPYNPADPNSVTTWWDGLDEQTQTELQRAQPDLLRNLDGIPPTTRDTLNRAYLDQTLTKLQEMYQAQQLSDGDTPVPADQIARMNELQATKKLLDQHADDDPPPSLLLVDTAGLQTKVVVTIGDITTVDHG